MSNQTRTANLLSIRLIAYGWYKFMTWYWRVPININVASYSMWRGRFLYLCGLYVSPLAFMTATKVWQSVGADVLGTQTRLCLRCSALLHILSHSSAIFIFVFLFVTVNHRHTFKKNYTTLARLAVHSSGLAKIEMCFYTFDGSKTSSILEGSLLLCMAVSTEPLVRSIFVYCMRSSESIMSDWWICRLK